jgi:hypothetical protein
MFCNYFILNLLNTALNMKKILLFLGFFVALTDMNAQLYVGANSYVYAHNQFVTVSQDVAIAATGNFYLRNEAQLLQKTSGSSTNSGAGNLSLYQEGTSNNFGYNYWCSPVGVPSGSSGNVGFGIGQLKRPTSVTNFGGESITTSYDGVATNSSLAISNRWIYKLITANAYANWVFVGSGNTIMPGEGFTMKGVSGTDNTTVLSVLNNPGNNQRYDFRGRPNDGTISIPVSNNSGPDYDNMTLTGNPYPSAINLNLFLLENSGYTVNYTTGSYTLTGSPIIDGSAYFWEHIKPATSHVLNQYVGGYGAYSPNGITANTPGTYVSATWNTYNGDGTPNTTGASASVSYKRMMSPVGQGFCVKGSVSGTAVMKNSYRLFQKEGLVTNSQFERHGATVIENTNWDEIPNLAGTDYTQFSKLAPPQIKLHTVMNNQITSEIALAFNPNAQDGYEPALDVTSPALNAPNSVYFPLADAKRYVISTLPFEITKRVPLALEATGQTRFEITVGELVNYDLSDAIYIYDKQTNMYHDILNGSFQVTLNDASVVNRFEVTFVNNQLSVPVLTDSDFVVYQDNNSGQLTIVNPNLLNVNSVGLYDLNGKLVFIHSQLEAKDSYQFPTSAISEAVYIVKINTSEDRTYGKKIIIKK